MARLFPVGALIAIALCVPATSAAQGRIPAHVRVLTKSERIMRWLGPQTDVILVVDQGTTLEVLDFDHDKGWYWVILPPDLHGTRKVGWIRATAVEPAAAQASDAAQPAPDLAPPAPASEPQRDSAPAQASVTPPTAAPAPAEERVTINVRRDAPAAGGSDVAGAKKSYAFEDVHFERDHFSIRSEDIERLRAAAAALKADPSLVVTIEGHTCSLGTGSYNLALGTRRANAVKDYLVSAGVPAERLLTVSQGEGHAEYDNSREETRRLNRRVALVPRIQR
ncbi:MAG TPA: OmpA family protein [Vicinamibacterales bacterium]|nr:OmpA family protein [Vicinamibacterales bacterium]